MSSKRDFCLKTQAISFGCVRVSCCLEGSCGNRVFRKRVHFRNITPESVLLVQVFCCL